MIIDIDSEIVDAIINEIVDEETGLSVEEMRQIIFLVVVLIVIMLDLLYSSMWDL